jgi:hypothetical protein
MIKTTVTIAAAVAFASGAGVASAQTGPQSFTIEFRFDAGKSAVDNYSAFVRKATKACAAPGPRPIAFRMHEQACIDDVMSQLVVRMARADIAAIHQQATGQQAVIVRDLAAR